MSNKKIIKNKKKGSLKVLVLPTKEEKCWTELSDSQHISTTNIGIIESIKKFYLAN